MLDELYGDYLIMNIFFSNGLISLFDSLKKMIHLHIVWIWATIIDLLSLKQI